MEVENLFTVSLAKLQQGVINFATGPTEPQLLRYQVTPTDPLLRAQCDNQKVKTQSNGHQNFNLKALIILAVLGTVFVALGEMIEQLDKLCTARCNTQRVDAQLRVRKWRYDGLLQLLRLAYTGANVGEWRDTHKSTPWTLVAPFSFENVAMEAESPVANGPGGQIAHESGSQELAISPTAAKKVGHDPERANEAGNR
jgi:hypothetical protein